MPARVAGERLGMTLAAIRVWAHRGILPCDQSSPSAKLWVRLTPEDIERVSGEADVAGMPRVREVAAREGVASADVWARVRSGELVAYRAPRGQINGSGGSRSTRCRTQPLPSQPSCPCDQRGQHNGHVSDEGARNWGRIASLIETAKMNGIEPAAYLTATLEAIARGHPNSRLHELLPWAAKPASS